MEQKLKVYDGEDFKNDEEQEAYDSDDVNEDE